MDKEQELEGLRDGQELDVIEKIGLRTLYAKEEISELDRLEDLKNRNRRRLSVKKDDILKMVRSKQGEAGERKIEDETKETASLREH